MWTNEEEVEGTIYNHPKKEEGYNDDDAYTQPYRHMTNWFLAKAGYEDVTRIPMPKISTKFAGINLYGELEPFLKYPERYPNAKVVVSTIKYWMFDRHRVDRGIWILSENGWYRLKKCSNEVIKQMNGVEISQSDIHDSFNAKIGLLSCIIDMMSEHKGYIKPSLVAFHSKLSPEESYTKLCPSPTQLAQNPSLNTEPFDLKLLKLDPSFVMYNLQNLDTVLSNDCAFMKGLQKLNKISHIYNRKVKWKKSDFKASSKLSEKRCCRWPWGEQILDEKGQWYNRMFELSSVTLNALFMNKTIAYTPDSNDSNESACDSNNVHESGVTLPKRLEITIKKRKDSESNIEEKNSKVQQSRKKARKSSILFSSLITKSKKKDLEKELEKYLEPNTGTIQEPMIAEFIKDIIYDKYATPESKLVSIDILRNSSIDVKKKLFDTNNTGESGVKGIFILWLDKSLQKVSNKRCDSNQIKKTRIENEVVQSILKLLVSFIFIKKKSQIGKIKEIFDVDLWLCVEKIQKVAKERNDQNMEKMCLSARSFLNNIQRNSTKKNRTIANASKFTKKQASPLNVKNAKSFVEKSSGKHSSKHTSHVFKKINDEKKDTSSFVKNTCKVNSFSPRKIVESNVEKLSNQYSKKQGSPKKIVVMDTKISSNTDKNNHSSIVYAKTVKTSIKKLSSKFPTKNFNPSSAQSSENSIETYPTKYSKIQAFSASVKSLEEIKEIEYPSNGSNTQLEDNSIHSKTTQNLIQNPKKEVEQYSGTSDKSEQIGSKEKFEFQAQNSNNLHRIPNKLSQMNQAPSGDSNVKLSSTTENVADNNCKGSKSMCASKNKQLQNLRAPPHNLALNLKKDKNELQCHKKIADESNLQNQVISYSANSENNSRNDSSNLSYNEKKRSDSPIKEIVSLPSLNRNIKNEIKIKEEREASYFKSHEAISQQHSNLENEDDSNETENSITHDKFTQYYSLLALEAAKRKMNNKEFYGDEVQEGNGDIMKKNNKYIEIDEDDIQDMDDNFDNSQVLVGDMLSCLDEDEDEDEYVDVNL